MEFSYKPKNKSEKFGIKIYSALVENFPRTFFVGGMVRDLLLGISVSDIDIATEAKPDQVAVTLKKLGISYSDTNKNFGVIVASQGSLKIEIATFRKDIFSQSRYPKVIFIKSPRQDSKRRDFSVNALYLSVNSKKILDFNNGFKDLKNKTIKFIGLPEKRITDDPLRIIRAIRFALILNFKLESKTKIAIKNNFEKINFLNKTRVSRETEKISNLKKKKIFIDLIGNKKLLDKYFK